MSAIAIEGQQVGLTIHSAAVPDEQWQLHEVDGGGAISKPDEYALRVSLPNPKLDLAAILASPVEVEIHTGGGIQPLRGQFCTFALKEAVPNGFLYEGRLVPKLWFLSLSRHNQIFQEKNVREIVAEILKSQGFGKDDFEDRCTETYPAREFVVQYQESDLDFINRRLAHEGIFYFGEHGAKASKLVLGDSPNAHTPFRAKDPALAYVAASGMNPTLVDGDDGAGFTQSVYRLTIEQAAVPASVLVKDYNYRNPHLPLVGQAQVDAKGQGIVMSYGEHVKDDEEAARIANIRAEELEWQKRLFHGETDATELAAGRLFTLEDHPGLPAKQKCLLVEVTHHARQSTGAAVSEGRGD